MNKFLASLFVLFAFCACAHKEEVSMVSSALKTDLQTEAQKAKSLAEYKNFLETLSKTPEFELCKPLRFGIKMLRKEKDPAKFNEAKERAERTMNALSNDNAFNYGLRLPEHQQFAFWTIETGGEYQKTPEYKSKASKVLGALERALPRAQRMDTRDYYAKMLGRLMLRNSNHPKFKQLDQYCDYLEASLDDGKPDSELRSGFAKLLKQFNTSATDIGYDSNWKTQMHPRDLGANPDYRETLQQRLYK
jgi:hypothetical protein